MKGVIFMTVTKNELNYAKIYLMNGSLLREGYLQSWEFGDNYTTVTLWFSDGFVVRTSVNYVFMFRMD